MNSSTLRRLAADHASLHNSPLPPHYLFPPSSSIPDDLTQLTILLAGPHGTSYAQGVWKLHLRIPEDYPKNPPKAAFKTRIWHPNVEEVSGAVCVDTLKKDWESKLTLRDVLVTISCLLIHPNPDSALNSTAAALLQEDYSNFSRQAALMTSIHARIPIDLVPAVRTAQFRGEDPSSMHPTTTSTTRPTVSRKPASTSSVTMKRPQPLHISAADTSRSISLPTTQPSQPTEEEDSEPENDENAENDPSLSPTPVPIMPILSPRRPTLTKRPLSDLPTPTESSPSDDEGGLSPSERNIAANIPPSNALKLAERTRGINDIVSPGRNNSWQQDAQRVGEYCIFDEEEEGERPKKRVCSGEGKENAGVVDGLGMKPMTASISVGAEMKPAVSAGPVVARKASSTAAEKAKAKGRAGLRRL